MTAMRNAKRHHAKIHEQGEKDFRDGKPITAFYQMSLVRHNELERGSYENGWRAAKSASGWVHLEGTGT